MKPLLLPGEIYESDVPVDAVYGEIEAALEPRGYFNLIYQKRAGNTHARWSRRSNSPT